MDNLRKRRQEYKEKRSRDKGQSSDFNSAGFEEHLNQIEIQFKNQSPYKPEQTRSIQQSQPITKTNSNITSPFNQKYIQSHIVDSVTPAANRQMPMLSNLPSPSQKQFGRLQNIQEYQSASKIFPQSAYDFKGTSEDMQYSQITPVSKQIQSPFAKKIPQSANKSSGRKSLKPLNEDEYADLKTKIAMVQSKLPESIQSRSPSNRPIWKSKSNKILSLDKQPIRSESQKRQQSNSSFNSRNSKNSYSKKPWTTGKKLSVPGADPSWLTQPMDALATQRRAQERAQKLFVPKNPRKFSKKERRSITERRDEAPVFQKIHSSQRSQESLVELKNEIGSHSINQKQDQKIGSPRQFGLGLPIKGGSKLPPVETSPRYDEVDQEVVKGTVKMKGNVDQWNKNGGPELFFEGLSKYFGVERSKIRIVDVRQGSVIVDYELKVDKSKLEQIKDLQAKLPEAKQLNLGCPIEPKHQEEPFASFFNSVRSKKSASPLKDEKKTPAQKSNSKPIQPYKKLIQAFNSGASPKSSPDAPKRQQAESPKTKEFQINPEKVEPLADQDDQKQQRIASKISEVESKKESSLSNFSDDDPQETDEHLPPPKLQDTSKVLSLIGKQSQLGINHEQSRVENASASQILQILDKPDARAAEQQDQKDFVNKSYQMIQRLQGRLASSLSNQRLGSKSSIQQVVRQESRQDKSRVVLNVQSEQTSKDGPAQMYNIGRDKKVDQSKISQEMIASGQELSVTVVNNCSDDKKQERPRVQTIEEKLIQYRIESDDYKQSSASEKLKTLNSKPTKEEQKPAKILKPLNNDAYNQMLNSEPMKVTYDIFSKGLLAPPPPPKLSPKKVENFLARQERAENTRRNKLEQVKQAYDVKATAENKFKPDTSKSRRSKSLGSHRGQSGSRKGSQKKDQPRSFEQFLRDQARHQAAANKKIENEKQKKQAKEENYSKKKLVSKNSRKILKNLSRREYSSSSDDDFSMDEGVRLLTRDDKPPKRKRKTSSDIEDMEEYPAQKPSSQKPIQVPGMSGPGGMGTYHQSAGILMPTSQSLQQRKQMFETMSSQAVMPKQENQAQALPMSNGQNTINRDVSAQYFKVSNPNDIQYNNNSININTSRPLMAVPSGIMLPGGGLIAKKDINDVDIFDPDAARSAKSSPTKSTGGRRKFRKERYLADTKSSQSRTRREEEAQSAPTWPLNRAESANIYYEKDFVRTNMLSTQIKNTAKKRSKSNKRIEPVREKDRFGRSISNKLQDQSSFKSFENSKQTKLRDLNPLSYKNTTNQPRKEPLTKKTEKILQQKFNKEFEQTLKNITKFSQKQPILIDSFVFSKLMVDLGCSRKEDMENDCSKEFKVIEEVWMYLMNCTQHPLHQKAGSMQKIFVADVKVLLMSVFGVQGYKVGIDDKGLIEDQLEQYPDYFLPFGFIGLDGLLCLGPKCVDAIRQKFSLLNSNRINHQGTKIAQKKQELVEANKLNFQPKLSALRMNIKILTSLGEKNPNGEFVNANSVIRARSVSKDYNLFRKTRDQWANREKQIKEKQEVEGCTFKPVINKPKTQKKNGMSQVHPNLRNRLINRSQSTGGIHMSKGLAQIDEFQREKAGEGKPKQSRFDKLYQLHKVQSNKVLGQLTFEEREWQEQQKECTFKPKVTEMAKQMAQPQRYKIKSGQEQKTRQDKEKEKDRVIKLRDESQQKVIERMKAALKVNLERQRALSMGRHYNLSVPPSQSSFSREETQSKIQAATRRLSLPKNAKKSSSRSKGRPEKSNRSQSAARPNRRNADLDLGEPSDKPLLFVDIDIGDGQQDRISVFNGDKAGPLANSFCKKHGFDDETRESLQDQLQEKIDKVKQMKASKENTPLRRRDAQEQNSSGRNPLSSKSGQGSNEAQRINLGNGQLHQIPERDESPDDHIGRYQHDNNTNLRLQNEEPDANAYQEEAGQRVQTGNEANTQGNSSLEREESPAEDSNQQPMNFFTAALNMSSNNSGKNNDSKNINVQGSRDSIPQPERPPQQTPSEQRKSLHEFIENEIAAQEPPSKSKPSLKNILDRRSQNQ